MEFGQVKRREFLTLIGGAAVWPRVARAQQPERMARIGYLGLTSQKDCGASDAFLCQRTQRGRQRWQSWRMLET
jgi:hypothetical protein